MPIKDDIAEGTDYYRKSYMQQKSAYNKLMQSKSFSRLSFEAQMLRHSEQIKPYLADSYPEMEDDIWIPPQPDIFGCMDTTALNYNPFATIHVQSACIYKVGPWPVPIPGCMDPSAMNYNPSAQVSDNSCVDWDIPPPGPGPVPPPGPTPPPWQWVYGCMDKSAINYNPKANRQPAGACQYEDEIEPGWRHLRCYPRDCFCPGLAKSIELVCTEPCTTVDFWEKDLKDPDILGWKDDGAARIVWGYYEGRSDASVTEECRLTTPNTWVIDTSCFPCKARIYAPLTAWRPVTFLAHFPLWSARASYLEWIRKLSSGMIDPETGMMRPPGGRGNPALKWKSTAGVAIKQENDQYKDPHTQFTIHVCPVDECCPNPAPVIKSLVNYMLAGDSLDLWSGDGNPYYWGWEQGWTGGGLTPTNNVAETTYYAASREQLPAGCSNYVTISIYMTAENRDKKRGSCAEIKILIQKIADGKAGNILTWKDNLCGFLMGWCSDSVTQYQSFSCDGTTTDIAFPNSCTQTSNFVGYPYSETCAPVCADYNARTVALFAGPLKQSEYCGKDTRTPEMIALGCCPVQLYLDLLE